MLIGTLTVYGLLALVAIVAQWRDPTSHARALRIGLHQLRTLVTRVPFTLLAASFLIAILPSEAIVSSLGKSSGLTGIALASVFGALLPGGPIVSFPLAVMLREAGVGGPQMVALLTAWAVLAAHRVLAFELPLLGSKFVILRLTSSLVLPPMAGILSSLYWFNV